MFQPLPAIDREAFVIPFANRVVPVQVAPDTNVDLVVFVKDLSVVLVRAKKSAEMYVSKRTHR